MKELRQTIAALANKDEIIHTLGLTEEQSEEFWEIQFRAVKARFLSYLLFKHRMDMTLVAENTDTYDEQKAAEMLFTAEEMLNGNVRYSAIRHWWKTMGTYLHNRAFAAKREKQKIDSMFIAVLVFFPQGRPFYLNYNHGQLKMTEDDPWQFPIMSITDLNRDNLQEAAKDFQSVVKELGATHVKLLPKAKPV